MSEPVYLKNDQFVTRPTDTDYFLVAQNGVFLCHNTKFFKADVRVWGGKAHFTKRWSNPTEWEKKEYAAQEAQTKLITSLRPHEEGVVEYLFPAIKQIQLQKIVGFFDTVYKKHHAESIVLLYWDMRKKRYHYYCPPQKVSAADCRYPPMPTFSGQGVDKDEKGWGRIKLPPMCMLVGTIHSHCDFDTGYSSTDEKDEQFTDGVHAIIGCLGRKHPQLACMLIVDGKRFGVPNDDWMEGFEEKDDDFPKSWMKQVEKKSWSWTGGWWGGSSSGERSNKSKVGFVTNQSYTEKCPLCKVCLTPAEFDSGKCPVCKKQFGLEKGSGMVTSMPPHAPEPPPIAGQPPVEIVEADDDAMLYEESED